MPKPATATGVGTVTVSSTGSGGSIPAGGVADTDAVFTTPPARTSASVTV
ncbi:hypothetical protein [Microbacterium aurugineum]|nr:hypothetical protein [Microbacterium aurugineum]MCK8478974.1 hypothetical protein [Microbacterium aurugineum]